MKKAAALILATASICFLIGCGSDNPQPPPSPSPAEVSVTPESEIPQPSPEPEQSDIFEITDLTHSMNIAVSKNYELIATIRYPQTGIEAIDKYYTGVLANFIATAESLAGELRSYDETGFATQYLLDDDYEVVKNSDDILSVHRTVYRYTGGAHGNNTDVCDNFRISDGMRLALSDIFDCPQEDYISDISGVFDSFIDSHGSGAENYYFFNDAKTILRDMFPLSVFCITDTGLNFYISPYIIAPYTSGTIMIPVSWDDLSVPVRESYKTIIS